MLLNARNMEKKAQEDQVGESGQKKPADGVSVEDRAYPSEFLGGSQLVIEDDHATFITT